MPRASELVPCAGQGCAKGRPRAAMGGQVSCGHFGDTSAKQPCAPARGGGGKQGHPPQLILHPFSLPQHYQMLPRPMECSKKYCFSLECFCLKYPG